MASKVNGKKEKETRFSKASTTNFLLQKTTVRICLQAFRDLGPADRDLSTGGHTSRARVDSDSVTYDTLDRVRQSTLVVTSSYE